MTDFPQYPVTAAERGTDPEFAGLAPSEMNERAAIARESLTSDALTPWTARDYTPLVTKSGAVKLASSGIAPLVAAARGYESVDESQAKDFMKRKGVGDGRSKKGTQFLASFRDDGDILVMPWYSVDLQQRSLEYIDDAVSTQNLQIRPKNPRMNEKGKPVKYEFLVGSDTVLDIHPSITRDWSASAPRVLLAEGLLKGDAALTAILRANGVTDAELALTTADVSNRLHAIRRLAQLAATIDESNRVAIVSLAGVGNWRSNQEWSEINVKDKDVLVAFDGDVSTNWNVWHMAKSLFSFIETTKKGYPQLCDINQFEGAQVALALDPHLGLDDFFHSVGDWSNIEEMITPDFPPEPERSDSDASRLKEWRVTKDGNAVEECIQLPIDAEGRGGEIRWQKRFGLGGRILFAETRRGATDEEARTGVFGAGFEESNYEINCAIEIKWRDEISLAEQTAEVFGPISILSYPPNEWDRRGARIPKALSFHPEWPPTKNGAEWLSAIKRNEAEKIDNRTTWSTMGYVPVENEVAQAFIIGDTTITTADDPKVRIRAGVTDRELSGASKFGVSDVYMAPDFAPVGQFNLVEDIKNVVNTLVDEGPWRTRQVAVSVLAMALRPTVPLPNSLACYFVGPPGKGKSWTARQIMSFWQSAPGTWEHTLPGSANDTFSSTEDAVARTPIWVTDDMAPSSDRKKAEVTEGQIGELIRAVFNKLGKRRMNFDMTAKDVPTPMALYILTAENEHSTQSIRERIVNIEFAGLDTDNFLAAQKMANNELTAARVTAATIRMFIARGEEVGWEKLVSELTFSRINATKQARDILIEHGVDPNDTERPAGIVADLSLGLVALGKLADRVGLKDIQKRMNWNKGGWYHDIALQVASSHQNKAEMAPGKVLIDCITSLLSSGAAHIANLDAPSLPPITTGDNAATLNSLLGWKAGSNNELAPRGVTIGYYSHKKPGGVGEPTEVIILNRDEAFNEAQRKYPKRIQFGASQSTSWKSVWELGLVHEGWDTPKSGVVHQFRAGQGRITGIPVTIEILYPNDPADAKRAANG